MAETLTFERTTAELLNDKINSDDRPVLINALPRESYLSRRIPGSISIPVDHADRIKDIVPDKDQDIVVYCANADCEASSDLARVLAHKGYARVWDFEDGMEGWEEEGYHLVGKETR